MTLRRWRLGALALAVTAFAAACGPAPDPLAPPEIVYGEDVCDACGMIISEERFAAAMIVSGAHGPEARRFDDIGDMLDYHSRNPDLTALRWYVHDHDSLEWLDAGEAVYVKAARFGTPMGSGLAAFRDAAAAEAKAAEMGGEVLRFEDLEAMPRGPDG